MPDFNDFFQISEQFAIPTWLLQLIWLSIFLLIALAVIWLFLLLSSKIKEQWVTHFVPIFYKPENKRRTIRRRRFADHIESEIRRLNNLEAWSDYRFAELEAEVEAEGQRRTFGQIPFLDKSRGGLRREKSLSKALEKSAERLILLEGDPGSGKSVALRYVTQLMAKRAMKARNINSVIPIYINLKELDRIRFDETNIVRGTFSNLTRTLKNGETKPINLNDL
ncbi:MAG: hypothetical protein AAF629_34355, partial [Chloroflexota bacterium]